MVGWACWVVQLAEVASTSGFVQLTADHHDLDIDEDADAVFVESMTLETYQKFLVDLPRKFRNSRQ